MSPNLWHTPPEPLVQHLIRAEVTGFPPSERERGARRWRSGATSYPTRRAETPAGAITTVCGGSSACGSGRVVIYCCGARCVMSLLSPGRSRLPQSIRLALTALLMAVLAMPISVRSFPSKGTYRGWRNSQVNKIREAVFHYQIQECVRENPRFVKLYFLAVNNGVDPDEVILKHFLGHNPPIEGVSSSEGTNPPIEKHTGTVGVLLEVRRISWVKDNKVEVSGSRIYSGTGGYYGIYQVLFAKGRWNVSKYVLKRIS